MFGTRTTIGHNHQKRFGRNAKKRTVYKTPGVQQDELSPDKLPEKVVKYNPFESHYTRVGYLCPYSDCRQRDWLRHPDGRRNTVCHFCGKEFILKIERKYA